MVMMMVDSRRVYYRMTHFLYFFFMTGGSNAATIACCAIERGGVRTPPLIHHQSTLRTSSNTFLSPFWVNAEHSTYLTAPNSLASFSPDSVLIGLCFCRCSFSITCESSLRSI